VLEFNDLVQENAVESGVKWRMTQIKWGRK